MVRRLRHSAAVDPRERAEMNALLVATDQKDAALVRAMIEGAANPDAVVDKAHGPRMPRRDGGDWAKWDGNIALLIACCYADLTIARLLLEAGASTELRVYKNGTLLRHQRQDTRSARVIHRSGARKRSSALAHRSSPSSNVTRSSRSMTDCMKMECSGRAATTAPIPAVATPSTN